MRLRYVFTRTEEREVVLDHDFVDVAAARVAMQYQPPELVGLDSSFTFSHVEEADDDEALGHSPGRGAGTK